MAGPPPTFSASSSRLGPSDCAVFSRWIRSIGIGTAAYLLRLLSDEDFLSVLQYIEQEIESAKVENPSFYDDLPVTTIEQISDLYSEFRDGPLRADADQWKKKADALRRSLPPIRALAHHIRFGPGSPAVSTAFGESLGIPSVNLLRQGLGMGPGGSPLLSLQDLEAVRSGWTSTEAKITAIERLRTVFPSDKWPQLANALYHQVFTWPLLVPDGRWPALSLPVAIDVDLTNHRETRK